jgi:hypothetical protein
MRRSTQLLIAGPRTTTPAARRYEHSLSNDKKRDTCADLGTPLVSSAAPYISEGLQHPYVTTVQLSFF